MKCVFFIFTFFLAVHEIALAQGSISGFPTAPAGSTNFNINFLPVSSAPANVLPLNSTCFYSLENVLRLVSGTTPPPTIIVIPTNVFEIGILLGDVVSTDASILQMGSDGSLTPITGLSLESSDEISSSDFGSSSEVYFDAAEIYLTDSEIESLSAGDWYVEIGFGNDSYLGQIVSVPEPSDLQLTLCGGGLLICFLRKKRIILIKQDSVLIINHPDVVSL